MPCSITYPASGGDGAVNGDGKLVSCCGQWHRPTGSSPGAVCEIRAKVYPATGPVDADPPADAEYGTLLPDPTDDSGSFHFNGSPLDGAAPGTSYRVKIWITADDITFYEPFGPQSFHGCVYGAGDCDNPPCLAVVGVCHDDNVIDQIAPIHYLVEPDVRTFSLFDVAKSQKAGYLAFEPIELIYSLADSSPALAVWSAPGIKDPSALRLEVKRGSCGCLTATLYLLRMDERHVEPTIRWRSEQYNLISGGVLEAISAKGKKVGGCLRISVPSAKKKGKGEKVAKE